MNYKNKKIAIVGFGVEGTASTHFLLAEGASITVFDEKTEEEFDTKLVTELKAKGVAFVLGKMMIFLLLR